MLIMAATIPSRAVTIAAVAFYPLAVLLGWIVVVGPAVTVPLSTTRSTIGSETSDNCPGGSTSR